MTSAKRPKAKLWTDANLRRWQETGEKPSPVMVWTPAQFGVFLDHAEKDRLYGLLRGDGLPGPAPRRGCRPALGGRGPGRADADRRHRTGPGRLGRRRDRREDRRQCARRSHWATRPRRRYCASTGCGSRRSGRSGRPRTPRGSRAARRAGRGWSREKSSRPRTAAGCTRTVGDPDLFKRISREAGLPPINLRDVRHIAATLIHAGGGDLHAIKEVLRHSTITLASDTYTSLARRRWTWRSRTSREGVVPRARRPVADEPVVESGGVA